MCVSVCVVSEKCVCVLREGGKEGWKEGKGERVVCVFECVCLCFERGEIVCVLWSVYML